MPEQHERIGQRRLAAAAAVARGTRTSAGALRPDLEDVAELHRGNAAATGADGLDVDSVRPERMARDLYLRLEQRPDRQHRHGPARSAGTDRHQLLNPL